MHANKETPDFCIQVYNTFHWKLCCRDISADCVMILNLGFVSSCIKTNEMLACGTYGGG
jgi:hypothetical protein